MVRTLVFALSAWLLLILAPTPSWTAESESSSDDTTAVQNKFEKHYLVLLIRPENPPELEAEKSAEIQSAHLAHLYQLWVQGDALIAGPFEVAPEERMRGMVLLRGDLTSDEVKALAEADPAVQAGRLEVQVLPWWHGEGLIQFAPPPDAD